MKNAHNLQIDVAAVPRGNTPPQVQTAHALDVDVLHARIEEARQARASMEAALTGAPLTSIPTLVAPPPTAAPPLTAPPTNFHVKARPRKTAPCKMYAYGRCNSGDACNYFHDPDALWTPGRSITWCWRYMAGVCFGVCKFWHPNDKDMAILMKHTPCLLPSCTGENCPRRHDDVDFDPEFNPAAKNAKDAPRLTSTISPRERAEHAAAMRGRLQARMPLRVNVPVSANVVHMKARASPTDSTSSSGADSLPTPATSRADTTDDWRARDSEERAEFPHTPSATSTQVFAAAMGRLHGNGHARRQSVWMKKDENLNIPAAGTEPGFTSWRGKDVVRSRHARSQSWAPFDLRVTFP
ncbi:unnamed protein product [Peniophora sp. CBMAI 1063]|nr:unnamed protein product [Peniophora sp. CBMAI 1063]